MFPMEDMFSMMSCFLHGKVGVFVRALGCSRERFGEVFSSATFMNRTDAVAGWHAGQRCECTFKGGSSAFGLNDQVS